MKLNKEFLKFIRNIFTIGFVLFVIFIIMELIKPKIVVTYINLNWCLAVILILGIISVLLYTPEKKEPRKLKFLDYSTIILFSLIIGLFVFYLIKGIGLMSILVGVISAIISYLFIVLINKGPEPYGSGQGGKK